MGFAVTSEQIALFLNKNCQVIFIDHFFFIIKIIPYKAAFLAVFRNGLLSKDFLVLVNSICDSMNYILEEDDLLQVFSLVNNYLDPGSCYVSLWPSLLNLLWMPQKF